MTNARHKLNTRVESLKADNDLSDENRNAILAFLEECEVEGLSPIRQVKYIYMFKAICSRLAPSTFSLPRATKEDLRSLVAAINRSSYADPTQVDLKNALKKYYSVLSGGSPTHVAAFIKARVKKATSVTRDHIFTPEEVRLAVSELRNVRDRAFVMVLYESGARPGELLRCRIGDVRLDDEGDSVFLRGLKGTPDRCNALVDSGLLLREWLRSHPCARNPSEPLDPTAPLWIKLEQMSCRNCGVASQFHRSRGCGKFEAKQNEELHYDSIRLNFKRACVRAGIRKPRLNLYALRHTRITEMAQFMSNQQLCRFAGWKPSSGQFTVYVHLTSDDVNRVIRQHYGLDVSESSRTKDCHICGSSNPEGATECRRCRRPLTLERAASLAELRQSVALLADLQEQGKLDRLLALADAI